MAVCLVRGGTHTCLVEAEAMTHGDQGGWWLPQAVASEEAEAEVTGYRLATADLIGLKFNKIIE